MAFFRKYGFGIILFVLMLASVLAFAETNEAESRHEAQQECELRSLIMTGGEDDSKLPYTECLDPNEVDDRFWDGFWENTQSEYQQLFVQFLGLVAFARWVAYKQQEDLDEIKAKLDELERGKNVA